MVAVNFLIAEKYIAALHALAQAPNQKVVIVPMDLASLAGTVGGLGQIAASALGGDAFPSAATAARGARTRPITAVPDSPEPLRAPRGASGPHRRRPAASRQSG